MQRPSQTFRYWVVTLTCFCVSLLGVVRAVHIGDKSKGGQGGALATAIAVVALLVRPDYGRKMYGYLTRNIDKLPTVEERLAVEVDALKKRLDINSDGQTNQSWWVAGASIIGAIFWGFGDVFAGWFCHYFHH